MRVRMDHGRQPDEEIAEVRWTPVPDAHCGHDLRPRPRLLAAFAALTAGHGEGCWSATPRRSPASRWHRPDAAGRPTRPARRRRNWRNCCGLFGAVRVVSASRCGARRRCSRSACHPIEPRLDETLPAGLDGARQALLALARQPGGDSGLQPGQGDPPLLVSLRPRSATVPRSFATAKGQRMLLPWSRDIVVAADRLS